MFLSVLNPSLEAAIAYQGESALFKALTAAFEELRSQSRIKNKSQYTKAIDKLVADHTGLKIELQILPGFEANAAVSVPLLNVNSPFWTSITAMYSKGLLRDFAKESQKKNGITGTLQSAEMDLLNGRVSGLFSQVRHDMYIWMGLLHPSYTNEELAATLLHEIGHAFTHLEALFLSCTMNLVLDQAWRELSDTTDDVQRLAIATTTAKVIGVKEQEAAAAAAAKSKDELSVLFLNNVFQEVRSATGASKYEFRLSEFSADRFASRHGAGRALVTALDKMDREGFGRFQKHRVSQLGFVLGEMLKVVALIGITSGLIIPLAIFGWLGLDDPEYKIYDDPGERIDRVRREMIAALKDRELPAEEQRRIHDDIKHIDELRKQITDRRSFYQWVWVNLTPSRRSQKNQMQFQQELERLANNDLFIKASQLNTLA